MTDIIETLREVENYPDKVVRERILIAAGEIERLRGIVGELAKEATDACKEHLEAEKDCIRLREENEKLYLENCHLRAVLSPFASEELLGWIKEANEAVYVESEND